MRLISVGLISCITLTQTVTAPQSGRAISIGMGFSGTAYGPPAITGAAYSAQEVTEHVQTLADGTHIKLKPRTMLLFRDSQGRTRTERPIGPPGVHVRVVE